MIIYLQNTNLQEKPGVEAYEKIDLYKRVVKAKLFIDDHFSEPIDLDNISGQAAFPKFHFLRLFKSLYGYTPRNYLIKIRIERAKELLKKGYYVSETGLMIGLESPTSFAGMFKRITGQSPSVFQKNERVKQKEMTNNPLQFVPNCFAETHGWTK